MQRQIAASTPPCKGGAGGGYQRSEIAHVGQRHAFNPPLIPLPAREGRLFRGRFDDRKEIRRLEARTANQRSIIGNEQASQPYPGDSQVAAAPVDGSYTPSVSRSSLEPVAVQSLPPVNQPMPAPAQPMRTAAAPAQLPPPAAPHVDRTTTGTVEPSVRPFKNASPEAPKIAVAEPRKAAAPEASREAAAGSEQALYSIVGSYLPFAKNSAQRGDDPRPAITERYRSREEYIARVAVAAQRLVDEHLLLAEDLERYVAKALAVPHWEAR